MTSADGVRSAPWLATLVAGVLAQAACSAAGPSTSYTKIDDMEGSGPAVQWAALPATPGLWYTATDCTQYDRISPPPPQFDPGGWSYGLLPTPHETFSGTVSTHAVRLRTTSPLVGIWGAALGFALAASTGPVDAGAPTDDAGACKQASSLDYPQPPVDLTAFAGLTFWARAESPGSRVVRVQVNDVNTDPRGNHCLEHATNTSDVCYNGFGVQIELTDTFRQYTLDFSRFTQRPGWGYHPPYGIDWSQVYVINFDMDLPGCTTDAGMCAGGAPSLSFDVWIDDLYFVNK